MKLGIKPIDRINAALQDAREYLGTYGWAKGTHGAYSTPTDLVGALRCAELSGDKVPSGLWVVAARMLATDGYDTAWNDLVCANLFEAKQALDRTYTPEQVEAVYGKNWYHIVGILRILSMATTRQLVELSWHIGPADEPAILSLLARTGDNPAYEDAHLLLATRGIAVRGAVTLMTDALIANCLTFPEIDERVALLLAPVAEKLGL